MEEKINKLALDLINKENESQKGYWKKGSKFLDIKKLSIDQRGRVGGALIN